MYTLYGFIQNNATYYEFGRGRGKYSFFSFSNPPLHQISFSNTIVSKLRIKEMIAIITLRPTFTSQVIQSILTV